jgi:hypothetical protein
MLDRATDVARAVVNAVSLFIGAIGRQANAWIQSGDTTLMVVLGALAVALLLIIVVPIGRRF